MDSAFLLADGDRAFFLRSILEQTFGGTYICLWEYNPQALNCLVYKDGFFGGDNQASSSMGNSGAHRLFNEYTKTPIPIDVNDDRIPGLALKNNRPYLELGELDLLTKASSDMQRQFYQEVGIKTAVFMGCNHGEIEIGFSTIPQADIQSILRNLFPDDFCKLSQPVERYRPPSSSSSLISLSTMDSPAYSSLLFNIHTTTQIPKAFSLQEMPTTARSPTQQAMHAFAQLRNIQFPSLETEEAEMTRALLAVFSSSSLSTSTSQTIPPFRSLPNYSTQRVTSEASAFKDYRQGLACRTSVMRSSIGGQSMMKRSIAFFRNLNSRRLHERMQSTRYNTTLQHMIAERRRREKLNEKFQALRDLLPPQTKKDKASILTSAKETLGLLMAQIEELSKRNEQLEAQLLPASSTEAKKEPETSSSNERIVVRISHVAESTSEARFIDLQVTVRARCPQVDLLICLLRFLKQDQNVNLISIDANRGILQYSSPVNHVTLRLSIEGSDWDESAFQEAIRRVVSDLAQ